MSTIIFIHGGTVFASEQDYHDFLQTTEINPMYKPKHKWREWIAQHVDAQCMIPRMPNGFNAKYDEWKIWFDRHLEYADTPLILVGHSLGGSFLLRYLSEESLQPDAVFLVSPTLIDKQLENGEVLASFTPNPQLLDKLNSLDIHYFYSTDDFLVGPEHREKLRKHVTCTEHIFSDRGHFLQETFPELLEEIKKYL